MLQTLVHSDAEAISTDLLSSKGITVSSNSSSESKWFGSPVEENIQRKVMNHLMFQVIF